MAALLPKPQNIPGYEVKVKQLHGREFHSRESGSPPRRATHRIAVVAGTTVFFPCALTGGV